MSKKYLAPLLVAGTFAVVLVGVIIGIVLGRSVFGLVGQEPTATPTPTKTLVPTFTATPTSVFSPTDTPMPTSTPMSTMPPETPTPTMPPDTPTPTETATPTLGPPTDTPTPRPPAATPTPRPPTPTNTPQPVYEYHHVGGPIKDQCHPGYCLPEIAGEVRDAEGNPVSGVWLKLESEAFGVQWCMSGDPAQALQPGHFKFQSEGLKFGEYTLTLHDGQGGRPLSAPFRDKMKSYVSGGQQTGIIFRRTY